jgi:hypothetical protein
MTNKKFKTRIVKLGEVGVDSGQLMICDPCYLDEFINPDNEGKDDHAHTIYKHVKTGKLYQYCYRNSSPGNADIISFNGSYETIIPEYGKTPNQLIKSKEFIPTDLDPTPHIPIGEFSYRGICKAVGNSKNQGAEINMAVAFISGFGDGSYEVFAEIIDLGKGLGERIKKVWVELITDEELKEFKNEADV